MATLSNFSGINIQSFCGVLQNGLSDSKDPDITYSDIEASWNRSATLWDDGVNKYLFWGDVQGDAILYNIQLDPEGDCISNVVAANWNIETAQDLEIYQARRTTLIDNPGTVFPVIDIEKCLYSSDIVGKRPKQVGDVITIEGGTQYKIFKASPDIDNHY
jgi:hypothetical protein